QHDAKDGIEPPVRGVLDEGEIAVAGGVDCYPTRDDLAARTDRHPRGRRVLRPDRGGDLPEAGQGAAEKGIELAVGSVVAHQSQAGRRVVARGRAGGDELPAGLHKDRLGLVIAAEKVRSNLPTIAKAGVKHSVGVEAGQGKVAIAGRGEAIAVS